MDLTKEETTSLLDLVASELQLNEAFLHTPVETKVRQARITRRIGVYRSVLAKLRRAVEKGEV